MRYLILAMLVMVTAVPMWATAVDRTEAEQNAAIDRLNCAVFAEDCPTPTPEPEPTATSTPHDHTTMARWHAPGGHDGVAAHEHGDAPPSWVTGAMFDHAANTPQENALPHKHSAFKGFAATLKGVELYFIFHWDTNPGGHANRFHSYQAWARDGQGGISHWSGWLDFGAGNNTGPTVVTSCQSQTPRPVMIVNAAGCPLVFETWYAANIPFGWDVGLSASHTYYLGGVATDPATWVPTGGLNLTRRIEVAFYADRYQFAVDSAWPDILGADWDYGDPFWATQFGQIVSGPDDPLCGTSVAYGTRSYTVLCLEQRVSPTLPTVAFPGNAVQRTFPGPVELPN